MFFCPVTKGLRLKNFTSIATNAAITSARTIKPIKEIAILVFTNLKNGKNLGDTTPHKTQNNVVKIIPTNTQKYKSTFDAITAIA